MGLLWAQDGQRMGIKGDQAGLRLGCHPTGGKGRVRHRDHLAQQRLVAAVKTIKITDSDKGWPGEVRPCYVLERLHSHCL
jgi:hypothetical protein